MNPARYYWVEVLSTGPGKPRVEAVGPYSSREKASRAAAYIRGRCVKVPRGAEQLAVEIRVRQFMRPRDAAGDAVTFLRLDLIEPTLGWEQF